MSTWPGEPLLRAPRVFTDYGLLVEAKFPAVIRVFWRHVVKDLVATSPEVWPLLLQVNRAVLGLKCRPFVLDSRCAVFLKPLLFASGSLLLTGHIISEG